MEERSRNTAIYTAFDEDEPFDMAAPEKELLRAVLLSAMSDLGKNGSDGRKAKEFFLNSDEKYLYSFQSICTHLNVDPKTILVITGLIPVSGELGRQRVARAKKRAAAQSAQRNS